MQKSHRISVCIKNIWNTNIFPVLFQSKYFIPVDMLHLKFSESIFCPSFVQSKTLIPHHLIPGFFPLYKKFVRDKNNVYVEDNPKSTQVTKRKPKFNMGYNIKSQICNICNPKDVYPVKGYISVGLLTRRKEKSPSSNAHSNVQRTSQCLKNILVLRWRLKWAVRMFIH